MFFAVSSPSKCSTLEAVSSEKTTEASLDVMALKIKQPTTPTKTTKFSPKRNITSRLETVPATTAIKQPTTPTKTSKFSPKRKITSSLEIVPTAIAQEPGSQASLFPGSTSVSNSRKTCTGKKSATLTTVDQSSEGATSGTTPKTRDRSAAYGVFKTCLPLVNVMIVLTVAVSCL